MSVGVCQSCTDAYVLDSV